MPKKKNPVLIRNGSEPDHFNPDEQDLEIPGFLVESGFENDSPKVQVGYVGAVADWFDVELMRFAANQNRDKDFHICGSITNEKAVELESLDNIYLYGEIKYQDVPAFIKHMDVLLIPFMLTPIIEACDPVKFYEYSSMGKPTVSTNLPELSRARELVYLSNNAADFSNNITLAYQGGQDPELRARLKEFAAENSWHARAASFSGLLEQAPKVSIVVLSYGDPVLTANAINSLNHGGAIYSNLEIIVVDNGSGEKKLRILKDRIDENILNDVIFIENDDNLGFARGNNIGILRASGDYVLLLNNDTYVAPGAISALVAHLENNTLLGVVGPLTNNIGNEALVEVHYSDMDEMIQAARRITRGYRGQLTEIPVVAYFAAMFRKADLDKFGLLSEEYGLGMFEDDDHCAVIRSHGYFCGLAEDAFVHHHLSASFDADGLKKKQLLFEKNKAIYQSKWGTWTPHSHRKERPVPSAHDADQIHTGPVP